MVKRARVKRTVGAYAPAVLCFSVDFMNIIRKMVNNLNNPLLIIFLDLEIPQGTPPDAVF